MCIMSSEFRRFLGVARKLWNTMQKKILKFSWYIWNFSGLILHSFKCCISHSGRIWKMHCRCLRARGRAVLGGHGGPVSLSPLLWYPQWPRHSHRGVGPQPPTPRKPPHKISCNGMNISALSSLNTVLAAPGGSHMETGKHLLPKGSIKDDN